MIKLKTPTENRIAKEFFLNFTTGAQVSKKLYPKSKNKNVGIVSGCFSRWEEAGYMDEKYIFIKKKSKNGKQFTRKIIAYRLNLNPYFDYLEEKGVIINKSEKSLLKKEVDEFFREDVYELKEDLFQSIEKTIKKSIILYYLKNQFFQNQMRLQRDLKRYNKQMMIISLIDKLCDELTKESLCSYLRLYLFNLIKVRNFGEYTNHLADLIERIEGKKELKHKIFDKAIIRDVTKIIVPIYREIQKTKNKQEIDGVFSRYNLDIPLFGFKDIDYEH